MTRLYISKSTEAKAIAQIWNMGAESLDPIFYERLEKILIRLCMTRHIDRKSVGIEHTHVVGKYDHDSDCSTNDAPAMVPHPCNCRE